MIPSIRISIFDNTFTDNCAPVRQTNDRGSKEETGPRRGSKRQLVRRPFRRLMLFSNVHILKGCGGGGVTGKRSMRGSAVIFSRGVPPLGRNTRGFSELLPA